MNFWLAILNRILILIIFWQNSNIELIQIGYRPPLVPCVLVILVVLSFLKTLMNMMTISTMTTISIIMIIHDDHLDHDVAVRAHIAASIALNDEW